jgi:hypothetical protein
MFQVVHPEILSISSVSLILSILSIFVYLVISEKREKGLTREMRNLSRLFRLKIACLSCMYEAVTETATASPANLPAPLTPYCLFVAGFFSSLQFPVSSF